MAPSNKPARSEIPRAARPSSTWRRLRAVFTDTKTSRSDRVENNQDDARPLTGKWGHRARLRQARGDACAKGRERGEAQNPGGLYETNRTIDVVSTSRPTTAPTPNANMSAAAICTPWTSAIRLATGSHMTEVKNPRDSAQAGEPSASQPDQAAPNHHQQGRPERGGPDAAGARAARSDACQKRGRRDRQRAQVP